MVRGVKLDFFIFLINLNKIWSVLVFFQHCFANYFSNLAVCEYIIFRNNIFVISFHPNASLNVLNTEFVCTVCNAHCNRIIFQHCFVYKFVCLHNADDSEKQPTERLHSNQYIDVAATETTVNATGSVDRNADVLFCLSHSICLKNTRQALQTNALLSL